MLFLFHKGCNQAAFGTIVNKRACFSARLAKWGNLGFSSYAIVKSDVSVNYSQISFFISHVPALAGAFSNRQRWSCQQGCLTRRYFNLRHKGRVNHHLIGKISGIVGHLSARVRLPALAVTAAHCLNGRTPGYKLGALRNNQPNPLLCYVLQPFSLHACWRSRPRR